MGSTLMERISSWWNKFFSLRVDPTEMGRKLKLAELQLLEVSQCMVKFLTQSLSVYKPEHIVLK